MEPIWACTYAISRRWLVCGGSKRLYLVRVHLEALREPKVEREADPQSHHADGELNCPEVSLNFRMYVHLVIPDGSQDFEASRHRTRPAFLWRKPETMNRVGKIYNP